MNSLMKLVSSIALAMVVVPCVLYWLGMMSLISVTWAGLFGTIGWFLATPVWMSRKLPIDADKVEI